MLKIIREIMIYFMVAIIALVLVVNFMKVQDPVEEINFNEFINRVKEGKIIDATINNNDGTIQGRQNGETHKKYRTEGPVNQPGLYYEQLKEKGTKVSFSNAGNSWWAMLLPNLGFFVLFIIFWFFLINQMQNTGNKALSFGKSRARLHAEDKTKTTFDDIAGADEAKEELVEIVEFLRQPRRFTELGAKIPKGVLLIGHPGTGKTLLAKAVAGEAGVPFFSISGSDFVEMFVGVGAARVRDMFDAAKKNAPCIVFIDEIDAVGRQRGAGLGGGHDEREQTLNQLLVEMDGFEPNSGIIILAATNRPDVLDPALLRPGRFDRQVFVDKPDVEGRVDILKIHARNKPLADDIDLQVLARRTPGFTGADLENLMNEAAILAARKNKKRITMLEAEEAIDRVIMGPERKKRVISDRDKEVFAYHEAGHAVVARFLEQMDPVHKVSIISRGMAGGYTMVLPIEDKYVTTRTELLEYLTYALGGRAAEELVFQDVSTGAQNDIERATKLARKMITEYGMSEKLGPMTFGHGHEDQVFLGRDISRDRNYSEQVAAVIDAETKGIIEDAYERAKSLLQDHRTELERVVVALIEKETLDKEEFEAVIQGKSLDSPDDTPLEEQK